MSRADPAGGEDVIEGTPHLVDGGYDDAGIVGNHPRFPQPNPDLVQPLREEAEIGVLGASRQDLVADDQDAGGDDFGLAGRDPLLWFFGGRWGTLQRQMREPAQLPGPPGWGIAGG